MKQLLAKPTLFYLLIGIVIILLSTEWFWLGHRVKQARQVYHQQTLKALPPRKPALRRLGGRIPPRSNFTQYLEKLGISAGSAGQLLADAKPIYNLARIRAGNQLYVYETPQAVIQQLRYQINLDHQLWLTRSGNDYRAQLHALRYRYQWVGVSGTVSDSLFNAVQAAGEHDQLALMLAGIFGWDIDFNTDTRPGDSFRVLVQKRFRHGQFAGYGQIMAAEYVNRGHAYQALHYSYHRDGHLQTAYFQPDGRPLKREFLSSPLRFAAPITSPFSYHRFHPILKIYRPHLGIDFGAPYGSPVQSIGNGTVVFAGWDGEAGRLIKIHHANGYLTLYMHLSRILVHRGEHVQQGELIGRVGSTGLSTGPHLDFRIEHDGTFENFEVVRRHLPPAAPLPHRDLRGLQQEWRATVPLMASLNNRGEKILSVASLQSATLPPEISRGH